MCIARQILMSRQQFDATALKAYKAQACKAEANDTGSRNNDIDAGNDIAEHEKQHRTVMCTRKLTSSEATEKKAVTQSNIIKLSKAPEIPGEEAMLVYDRYELLY